MEQVLMLLQSYLFNMAPIMDELFKHTAVFTPDLAVQFARSVINFGTLSGAAIASKSAGRALMGMTLARVIIGPIRNVCEPLLREDMGQCSGVGPPSPSLPNGAWIGCKDTSSARCVASSSRCAIALWCRGRRFLFSAPGVAQWPSLRPPPLRAPAPAAGSGS